ncbi:MAG: AMP-binding protein [Rhodococcus sp. (in: high G+C Gram-positive bacteria)]
MTAAALTVADLLRPLRDVADRGVKIEDRFVSWSEHRVLAKAAAQQIESLIPEGRPPHFGVLLPNIEEMSILLEVAGTTPLVLVALNPLRTPAALATDAIRADCAVIVTNEDYRKLTSSLPDDITVLDVSELRQVPAEAEDERTPEPDELFALVFTSGTSGDPKAVRCTQSKVAGAGLMLAGRFGLGERDTVYVSMPLFHSNAILAGWAVGIASGGSVALARRFSASRFISEIRRFGATYANYVGTPLSYVLSTPGREDDRDNPLRNAYGNEGHPDDLKKFASRFDVTVTDGYGSTEGGIAIRRTPQTPAAALGPLEPGIAVVDPLTDSVCATARFDADGRLLNPAEAVGELVDTTGPGRFTGYYRDPEAEAERLRGGWYRSGDLAYLDEQGFAYFAGRVGDWLRVRGENLGTRPIASALRSHPAIVDAAVFGVPGSRVGDTVMAAVVCERVLTESDLTALVFDESRLAELQRPSFIRLMQSLPRTASFKTLTRLLAAEGTDTDDPVYRLTADGYRAYTPDDRKVPQ